MKTIFSRPAAPNDPGYELRAAKAQPTLKAAVAALGIADPKIRSPKAHFADYCRSDGGVHRIFPNPVYQKHQMLVAASVPGMTVNDDGDFSAKHLTDWYVEQFCKENHLLKQWETKYRAGWYWHACCPGCLPDSDPMGPCPSATSAAEHALQGLEE